MYLHFPYCKHLCNYCDFYKLKLEDDKRQLSFTQLEKYLNQSFHQLLEMITQNEMKLGELKTIYFGGGTPSLWGDQGIAFVKSWFNKQNLTLAPNYEWTLEVDPGATNLNQLLRWKELGVNRFSIGIQTLNPHIFPLMDRSHNLNQVYELLSQLRYMSANFSVDFMLGLPKSVEHQRSIEDELEEVLSFNPSHLSLYFLSVQKTYKHFHALPEDDLIAEEYLKVVDYLKKSGFDHYEVASFAKPRFSSRHNFKYWSHQSVFALGPSATGFLAINSRKHLRFKWSNTWLGEHQPRYEIEDLNWEEMVVEKVYLTLRQGRFFDFQIFFDMGFNPVGLLNVFSRWKDCGYIETLNFNSGKMTASGWLILDALVQEVLTSLRVTPSLDVSR